MKLLKLESHTNQKTRISLYTRPACFESAKNLIRHSFPISIWSIDLAFIVKHLQVEHAYYTKTIGIDPSYSDEVTANTKKSISPDFLQLLLSLDNRSITRLWWT